MAKTTKRGPTGFVLGDPEGRVRWTPSALRKVLPRRELAPKAPRCAPVDSALEFVCADAKAIEPAVRAAQGAGRDAFDAGLAWLVDGAKGEPSIESMAAIYAASASSVGALVDLWCARFGCAWALRALCAGWSIERDAIAGEAVSVALPWGEPGNFDLRPRTHEAFSLRPLRSAPRVEWIGGYAWRRLKSHLAALADPEWSDCVALADAARPALDARAHSWLALAFCERPEWAEALAATPEAAAIGAHTVLALAVREPTHVPLVRESAYYRDFDVALLTALAAMGPRAAPLLRDAALKATSVPALRALIAALSMIDTDEALRAALEIAPLHPKLADVPATLAATYGADRVRALSAG